MKCLDCPFCKARKTRPCLSCEEFISVVGNGYNTIDKCLKEGKCDKVPRECIELNEIINMVC